MPNPPAPRVQGAASPPTSSLMTGLPAAIDFELLVAAHYPYVRRLAHSILDDPDEADDAAQETFIAAGRALASFRGEADPKTWLTRIAINTCRGRLRKRRVRLALQSTLEALHLAAAPVHTPEGAVEQREADRQVWQAVDELDEKHRLVVLLRYVHELSTEEIARALGASVGTVHSRLHYARQKLQRRLGSSNPAMEDLDGAP